MRLGLHRLPSAEVVLVQTLLRLYGAGNNANRWTVANAPPFDAVLVDATGGESASAEASRLTQAVLRISRIGSAGQADTIQRPIRAEQLFQWLNGRAAKAAPHPKTLDTIAAVPTATEVTDAVESPMSPDVDLSVRYRLKRWPPSVVLRNDARRVYLATLLSKRALSVGNLVAMSRQPVEDCHAFVRLLRATGLVTAEGEGGLPLASLESAATTSPASLPVHPRKRSMARGLIGQLRKKLGL